MTRARRNFERNRRFLAALVIAALYRAEKLSLLELLKAARGIIKAFLPHKHVDWRIYFRRLRHCHRCPVYYSRLATCGSPLADDGGETGCACQMQFKAALPLARCWANDSTDLDIGWPAELEQHD